MKSEEHTIPLNKLNILLADDDKDDCLLFKEALDELSIPSNLSTVHDGQQLMQLLTNNSGDLFDFLFLDLNMPRKNGYSCFTEIKANKKIKNLPVIIFSTSFDENIADLLYQNGAYFYICKPADFGQLKIAIQRALTLSEQKNIPQSSKEKFFLSILP